MNQNFITEEILEQAGVDLAGRDLTELLDQLNTTLSERVGTEITESLNDDQLTELSDLSENETSAWLQANVPELEQITRDEIDILIGELVEGSDITS